MRPGGGNSRCKGPEARTCCGMNEAFSFLNKLRLRGEKTQVNNVTKVEIMIEIGQKKMALGCGGRAIAGGWDVHPE